MLTNSWTAAKGHVSLNRQQLQQHYPYRRVSTHAYNVDNRRGVADSRTRLFMLASEEQGFAVVSNTSLLVSKKLRA